MKYRDKENNPRIKVFKTRDLSDTGDDSEDIDKGEPRIPVLIVLQGQDIGRHYILEKSPIIVGREREMADLVVDGDHWISSSHAIIMMEEKAFFLEDAGSRNGTKLNGNLIRTKHKIENGDKIALGKTVLKFAFHDSLEVEFHKNVEHMMNVDELTGLPVKRYFNTRFNSAVEQASSIGQDLTFLMMDMDGLKKINDTYGHQIGAGTISEVGRIIGEIIHPFGLVTRFGGDEFSAYLVPCSRHKGLNIAEKIRKKIEKNQFIINGISVNPTISIGISSMPLDGMSPGELFLKADEAL